MTFPRSRRSHSHTDAGEARGSSAAGGQGPPEYSRRVSVRRVLLALVFVMAPAAWFAPSADAERERAPVVRIPLPHDDGSLTPYTFRDAYSLVTLVYDTLLWRDANGVPRPWLARSVKRSDDGRRLTIRLETGVRWHDGRPLTAADVAFTFRLLSRRPHPRFTPQLVDLQDVEARGRDTVVMRLRRPSLGFFDQPLADVPILPKHLWEQLPVGRRAPRGLAVGSGPYRLSAHRRGEGYEFRANRSYFKGTPTVTRIRVPIIGSAAGTFAALGRGRVDMIPVPLPPTESGAQPLGMDVSRGPSYLGTVLMFNLRRAPFDRVEVRRAVAHALDLRRIAGAVTAPGGPTGAVAADRGYLHPASRWAPSTALQRFDPHAAGRVLRRLDRPIRVLVADSDPVRLRAAREVVGALRRAGARVELRRRSAEAVARAVGQDGAPPTFEAAIWSAPPLASYDPDFLRAVFGPGMALNYSGYSSRRFERLADRVASSPSAPSRQVAVTAELRRLTRDAPVVPLFFYDGAYAYRPAVYDGWVFVKGAGILDKLSFLPRPAGREAPLDTLPSSASGGSDGFPIFGALALVLVAGVIAVVARASLRERA